MFNSFGNLAVDPTAALLFIDFDNGAVLHLSGTAAVEWTAALHLDIDSDPPEPSPHNPAIT